jgi:putative PIN family toxin of toxin-antitoxin system
MPEKHKIVIDTNVIISALRSKRGASYKLMYQITRKDFEVSVSVPLVAEYEKVAVEQVEYLQFTVEEVVKYIDFICSIAKKRKIYYLWRPYLRDPKDDMVLELAVASGCKYLITFNKKDFRGIEKFGILALTPKEFLDLIGGIK